THTYLFSFPTRRSSDLKPFTADVKRIITGSTGLDDYEWGVSLFCHDPLQFKKLIYETRFDEVSARYGIFGTFYIGHRLEDADMEDRKSTRLNSSHVSIS